MKAAIFDVGGVLKSETSEQIHQDIMQTLGITEEQHDRAKQTLIPSLQRGQITEPEFWQRFVAETNPARPLPKQSLWAREFEHLYHIFEDVLEIVDELKQQGIKVAILSNTIEPHAKINRQKGLYDSFSEVVLSNEVGLAKPDEAIYRLILERLQEDPAEVVFIDDRAENVAAAQAVGMHGILFESAGQLREELRALGIALTDKKT
jgi:putative hydrolase of the HAD superfamily